MRREIIDDPKFTAKLAQLGNIQRLDERLEGVLWALWLDAEDFPLVSPDATVRVAPIRATGDEPPLSVWFEIEGPNVILLWIEPTPDAPEVT